MPQCAIAHLRIGRGDPLECLPRLRIRHVMQEGDRSIELHLGRFGAADGEVHRAQVFAGVRRALPGRVVREPSEQEH